MFMHQMIRILDNMIKCVMKLSMGWRGDSWFSNVLNGDSLVFYFGAFFFFSILVPFDPQVSNEIYNDNIIDSK